MSGTSHFKPANSTEDMLIEEQSWLPIAMPKKTDSKEDMKAEELAWLPIETSNGVDSGNVPPHPPAHKVGGRRVANPKPISNTHNDLPSVDAPVLGLIIQAMNETVSDTVEINSIPKTSVVKTKQHEFSIQKLPKHDKTSVKKTRQIQQPR